MGGPGLSNEASDVQLCDSAGPLERARFLFLELSFSELPFDPREGRFSICSERSTSSARCHFCGKTLSIESFGDI